MEEFKDFMRSWTSVLWDSSIRKLKIIASVRRCKIQELHNQIITEFLQKQQSQDIIDQFMKIPTDEKLHLIHMLNQEEREAETPCEK